LNIIKAEWITNHWCEYCHNDNQLKTYLPLEKSVLNPAHICEDCAKEHTIIDWFDIEKDYYIALNKLQENT
jgi:protein-arginine kinase activator protein McsA